MYDIYYILHVRYILDNMALYSIILHDTSNVI